MQCRHSTSLGAYGLCLNKPLPVKAGALALGSPLTRALVGELFSWPQLKEGAPFVEIRVEIQKK